MVLGAWVIDALVNGFSFGKKFKKFIANKPLVFISLIFLLHVVGLLYTSNFDFALTDLRNKLPLLVLPVLFAGAPHLKQSGMHGLMKVFVFTLFISTAISFYKIVTQDLVDLREAMVFTSHIRLGLMIAFAIFYFVFHFTKQNQWWKIIFVVLFFWFLFFIYKAQITTGLVVLFITAILLSISWSIQNWKSGFSKLLLLGMMAVTCAGSLYILGIHSKYFTPKEDLSSLAQFTADGEEYIHLTERTFKENGYFTDVNLAPMELETAWNEKSDFKYGGQDLKGQNVRSTLKRYMTSKGLKKDRIGVEQLTQRDIENIESGETNCMSDKWNPLVKKLNEIFYEYTAFENGANPSGNSLFMRTEFWRAGWSVFLKNKIIGTGTGDIKDELNLEYEQNGTLLEEPYRHRIHNQYLTFAASFGSIGFVVFLACFFYPFFMKKRSMFFTAFISISALSFLTEDTLETQVGVTFVSFFYCLFLTNGKRITT